MSRPYNKRKLLPGREYRYDAYGKIVKRKRPGYGPRHSQFETQGLDFSGNRQALIYFDIPCDGAAKITAAHVDKVKRLADVSGNPKVWRAGEYSQDFLKSLVPGNVI